jgi:hypothetical protein
VSGDLCEFVDSILVPRAAPNVAGNAGEAWKEYVGALLWPENSSAMCTFGFCMLGGLIGVVC